MPKETEYIVCDHPDGSVDLIGIERYTNGEELIKAVNDNHSENRDKFLGGVTSFFLSITLAMYSLQAFSEISLKANQIQKVEDAFKNRIVEEAN